MHCYIDSSAVYIYGIMLKEALEIAKKKAVNTVIIAIS
jgi:hypothetical protein